MAESNLPRTADWFQSGFHRFLRPYLKRHFDAIAVERRSLVQCVPDPEAPLIVYGNHPSWWDPLIAHFFNRTVFPNRQFYAPIDAEALKQYRVFEKLGFFGVQLDSASGASSFLSRCNEIVDKGGAASIWMTPEGRFSDARDHSATLMPGLAHLCARIEFGNVMPVALEYVFWDERLPVCLIQLGNPIEIHRQSELNKTQWNDLLTTRLRQCQRDLAVLAIARSSGPFHNLMKGSPGAGLVYDTMRRIKSAVSGKSFRAQHGDQFE